MSVTFFIICIFAMMTFFLLGLRAKKHSWIYYLLIALTMYILIACSPGGFKSGSSRSMDHYCCVCGKRTSLELSGKYYCTEHHWDRFWGN